MRKCCFFNCIANSFIFTFVFLFFFLSTFSYIKKITQKKNCNFDFRRTYIYIQENSYS
uniref:Hypothetical secreted peptide n=1 Tax=Glossina morsitans morsitans TaxID=37546 RepID=D3TSJ2_GLOMM